MTGVDFQAVQGRHKHSYIDDVLLRGSCSILEGLRGLSRHVFNGGWVFVVGLRVAPDPCCAQPAGTHEAKKGTTIVAVLFPDGAGSTQGGQGCIQYPSRRMQASTADVLRSLQKSLLCRIYRICRIYRTAVGSIAHFTCLTHKTYQVKHQNMLFVYTILRLPWCLRGAFRGNFMAIPSSCFQGK